MRRVLMISPHFPPDTSAGTHRVRLLAPHLPDFGWEPTVVTMEPAAYEGRLDPDLARLVPDTLRVVRARAWPAALTRRLGIGDLGLRSLPGLRRACERLLERERFDALFITIYPSYPAVLGPYLKRKYGLPFVLDYQDPWVGTWGLDVGGGPNGGPDLKSRLTRTIATFLEPRVASAADGLTAVSERTYADVMTRIPGVKPRVCAAIPLGFEERDLEALRRAPRPNPYFDERDGLIHVCYVGTALPKGLGVLRTVLDGLAELRRRSPELCARLRLHFLGTSNQRELAAPPRVTPLADAAGVADLVAEVPPRMDYLDALNVQVRANALLLTGSSEPHYTPSKVFPALLSRRPIIAVYHRASSVVDLLSSPWVDARTFTFEDSADLSALVPAIATGFERLASGTPTILTAAGRETAQPWSARTLAGTLAGVLDRGGVVTPVPEGLRVNVGSGPHAPEGWLSIDGSWQARLAGSRVGAWLAERVTGRPVGHWAGGIVCRDVRRGLGLEEGTAAVIFSSHLIEHLHRSEALALLSDAHRALKAGGVCRIVTPDLANAIDAYVHARANGDAAAAADRLQASILLHPIAPPATGGPLAWYRRRTAFDHHKWMYDGESLCALFREAGFSSPAVRGYLESDIQRERLAQVEHADRVCGGAGICVEARR